jgi:hypothetical protein
MSERTIPEDDRQRRLEEAMAEYLIAADAGKCPEAAEFLSRYPDLRSELAGFLADLSALSGMIEPILPVGAAFPGPEAALRPATTLQRADLTTRCESSETDPGATVPIDTASGAGATNDPTGTADFHAGLNETNVPDGLPNGTRVRYFGDYELTSELGRGGMGSCIRPVRLVSTDRSRSKWSSQPPWRPGTN